MKIFHYWKTLIWIAVILYLCLMPGSEVKKIDFLHFNNADKLVHFSLYFVLAILLLFDNLTVRTNSYAGMSLFLLPFTVTLILGGSVELIQLFFIDSRDGSILDMLANLSGMILGYLSFRIFLRYRKIS